MLSSFLLSKSALEGKKTVVDSGLDAIFAASAKSGAPVPKSIAISIPQPLSSNNAKRKRNDEVPIEADDSPKKRRTDLESEPTSITVDNKSPHAPRSQKKESKRNKQGAGRSTSSKDIRIEQLEEKYSKQRLESLEMNEEGSKNGKKTRSNLPVDTEASTSTVKVSAQKDEASSSSDDEDPSTLVHESLAGTGQSNKRRKVHYVPESETKEQRNQRTVFIGNLPVGIIKTKALQKSLRKYVLSCCSISTNDIKLKIESIRFRSVAFKSPTNLQVLKEEGDASESTRRQERAAVWKKEHKETDPMDEDAPKPIEYLTPSEKKRIAFIKGEFHDEATSVNAYVVFAHPDPELTETILDPFKAAALVVEEMNGRVFGGRTLRVDLADRGKTAGIRDPTATIFVGSLDFSADEESLRAFFETLLTTEMGPPKQSQHSFDGLSGNSTSAMDGDGPSRWVHDVRIIRDKDTQLGKGFAYIRFSERSCVDEILGMEPSKLKFAKRKLRVERCKGGENPSKPTKGPGRHAKGTAQDLAKEPRSKPPRVKSKGDPRLGERLKGLSKEERRDIKKNDPTRQARRMEKKKARLGMEKGMTAASKERVRARKGKDLANAKVKRKVKGV